MESEPPRQEEDFLSLPLEDRLVSKQWKARVLAFDELTTKFNHLRLETDPVFTIFHDPELIKNGLGDKNVIAQEAAYGAFVSYLSQGASPQAVNRLKLLGVVEEIRDKGLVLNRRETKERAVELVMLMIEILDDLVLEDLIPAMLARLAKKAVGSVAAVTQAVNNFGLGVVLPKPLLPVLPTLFGHADRTVRAEATKLAVAMYRWMGSALVAQLFDHLKPVQQKDLQKEFDTVEGKPEQLRFTRSQQQQIEHLQQEGHPPLESDVEMAEADLPAFDPYEHLEAIEVLLKIPANFESELSSSKWKERKEALEAVLATLQKAAKMASGDYAPLLRLLAKCMKDANIQVVQLAAQCIECIVKGLQRDFNYASIVVGPMVERTKEKKPLVANALGDALDAVFQMTLLATILDETLQGMKNKTPQVKIASTNFLQRCLSTTRTAPTTQEIDAIMEVGVKLLNDSQAPIRDAASEMIGTLMKITGERELAGFLAKVDKKRLEKVTDFYHSVQVSAQKPQNAPAPRAPVPVAAPRMSAEARSALRPQLALPAKRQASLPAKRVNDVTKRNLTGATSSGLTRRPLLAPKLAQTTTAASPDQMGSQSRGYTAPPQLMSPPINLAERDELIRLRAECETMREQLKARGREISELQNQIHTITNERDHWRVLLEDQKSEVTRVTLTAKQRETQVMRVQLELEDARYKIAELERQLDSELGLKLPALGYRQLRPPRVVLGDLSTRVNRLLIGSLPAAESPSYSRVLADFLNMGANDDLWRRAAEVTSQLKARIEKMKAGSRAALE